MILYADIIVDISHEKVDRAFQYRVPESLMHKLEVGMCVQIPFGKSNKLIEGYVIGLSDCCNFDPEKIKDIKGLVTDSTGVEEKMVRLAAWIRKNYGSTMIQALKTVLPARKAVKQLEHKSLERIASTEMIIAALGEARRKKQTAKERLLIQLVDNERIPYEWVTGKLGVSAATIRSLVNAELVKVLTSNSYRNPVKVEDVSGERKNDQQLCGSDQNLSQGKIFSASLPGDQFYGETLQRDSHC